MTNEYSYHVGDVHVMEGETRTVKEFWEMQGMPPMIRYEECPNLHSMPSLEQYKRTLIKRA